jgi:pimeloyl-ACP methyl ester carboxylesterase
MVRGTEPDPAVVDAYLAAAHVRGHAATLVAMLTRTRHGPSPDPATIEAPTLLLTGEQDGYMPPRRARALATRMPRAQAVTVPGAAHLLFEEQPEFCAGQLRAFLERDEWATTDAVESPDRGVTALIGATTVTRRRSR